MFHTFMDNVPVVIDPSTFVPTPTASSRDFLGIADLPDPAPCASARFAASHPSRPETFARSLKAVVSRQVRPDSEMLGGEPQVMSTERFCRSQRSTCSPRSRPPPQTPNRSRTPAHPRPSGNHSQTAPAHPQTAHGRLPRSPVNPRHRRHEVIRALRCRLSPSAFARRASSTSLRKATCPRRFAWASQSQWRGNSVTSRATTPRISGGLRERLGVSS